MSCLIINRGGASGGLKPELTVTALAESTIDLIQNGVTLYTYTLGADETKHTFVVRLGAYTIRSVLGAKEATEDVVIDTVGQYSVELKYRLWLYRDGNEFADLTGGWVFPTTYYNSRQNAPNATNANWVYDTCNGSGSVTKQKNADSFLLSVYVEAGNISTATAAIQNSIDLAPYSKLCAEIPERVGSGHVLGVRTKYKWPGAMLRAWGGDDSDIAVYTSGTADGDVYSTDVSAVSGLAYIAVLVGGYFGSATSGGAKFTGVWLE